MRPPHSLGIGRPFVRLEMLALALNSSGGPSHRLRLKPE
jgi:hypothetical protein